MKYAGTTGMEYLEWKGGWRGTGGGMEGEWRGTGGGMDLAAKD